MCYECKAGGENIENQEDNTKRKRKRILADLIRTKGWISNIKQDGVFRVFCVNPYGFGYDKVEKIQYLVTEARELQIDSIMLSSCDRKWNSYAKQWIKNEFQKVNQVIEINIADSGLYNINDSDYMPGGTISATFGN